MPPPARTALADVLGQLAEDPWSGSRYDPRWPREFRTATFGDGGLAAYVVSERRKMVLVEHVIWAG